MITEIDFLKRAGVTLFLDVGANRGQTGRTLRLKGYEGRIASFEPIAECYADLAGFAARDPDWQAYHMALGDRDGETEIGVSENFVSSSLLEATDALIEIHAPIRYTRQEATRIGRLDSLLPDLAQADDVIHLKLDTQGFEKFVIDGAERVLERIGSVRMEVAVSEVYRGEMILPEALTLMTGHGFVLIDAWPAWRHPETDEVLHFDLLFRRG